MVESREMRICLVGVGTSIHLQRLANNLAESGHEVHVVTMALTPTPGGFSASVRVHELASIVRQLQRLPRPISVAAWLASALVWVLQLRLLLRRIRPDVLNAHFVTIWGFLAAYSGYHPFIMTTWGSDIFRDPVQHPIIRLVAMNILRRADVVVCDSRTMEDAIVRLGIDHAKIRRVGFGVDTKVFTPSRRSDHFAQGFGEINPHLVVSIRNLRPVYSVETLIRAVPLVLSDVPSALFLIGGEGEQEGYLKSLAETLGVAENVRWLGYIPHSQMAELLASCDVYVSTSVSDSTSLSLLEAMACQVVPVVTDIPPNREWVSDGRNGFLVPKGDAGALANRIAQLLDDAQLRKELGLQCRQVIQARGEASKEIGKLEQYFLQAKRGRAATSKERT